MKRPPRQAEAEQPAAAPVLSLESVGLHYAAADRASLQAVDLRLQAAETVALVGASGAGKTTLLHLAAGTLQPTEGKVFRHGRDVWAGSVDDLRSVRARTGFIFQDFRLVPQLRVVHNVVSGALGRRSFLGGLRDLLWPAEDTVCQAHALLQRLGIEDKLFQRTDRLSGGEQQRVAVARALFQRPRILLADEPVASVDPSRSRGVLELLLTEARHAGIPLMVSLHNLSLAREYFSKLVGLQAGRLIFQGEVEAIDQDQLEALYADPTGSKADPARRSSR